MRTETREAHPGCRWWDVCKLHNCWRCLLADMPNGKAWERREPPPPPGSDCQQLTFFGLSSRGGGAHGPHGPPVRRVAKMTQKKLFKGEIYVKTDYLLHKEVEHVLAALTPSNRLVCEVMLHTGLRVGDVLGLRTRDLKGHLWVREAKTGKRKQIGLPAPLLERIRAQAGPEWAFPGRKPGKHRTRQAIWADIKRASRAFRLPQNVGPHSLRKVYAVALLDRYGDIDRVRKALNHGSVTTTMIYAMADRLLEARQAAKAAGKSRGGVGARDVV